MSLSRTILWLAIGCTALAIKLELSYLTLYNGECEETRWSFA